MDGDDDGEEVVELVGGPIVNPGPAVHHRYTDQTTGNGNCFEWKLINFEVDIFGQQFRLYNFDWKYVRVRKYFILTKCKHE